jgi:hypothetical protein
MITNYLEYADLAYRTAKPLDFEKEVFHYTLGLGDEAGELQDAEDPVNFQEELGDLNWFYACFLKIIIEDRDGFLYGLDFSMAQFITSINILHEKRIRDEEFKNISLVNSVFTLQGIVKSQFIYGKDRRLDLLKALLQVGVGINRAMSDFANHNRIPLPDLYRKVWQANIEKLKTRYPDKYTDEKAINRDLNSERKTLEEKL